MTLKHIFYHLTGLKVVIDLGQTSGKRVKSIYARCGNCTVIDYQELDLNAYYTVIMSQFLFKGGDGFLFNKSNNKFQSFGKCQKGFVYRFSLTVPNNYIRENRFRNNQRRN